MTVDCGITAIEEAGLCRQLGIDLVITDHHECKEILPEAVAVVDPHRPDGGYPHMDLSGVGIEKARRATFRVDGDIRACCLSDGFAQLAELFRIYDGYRGLLDAMEEESLQSMYDKLCAAQNEDADCIRYPRFKLRDDTCAVYGKFTK